MQYGVRLDRHGWWGQQQSRFLGHPGASGGHCSDGLYIGETVGRG